ncbi:hypothetical protein FPV67DRAFT_1665489 [Lyophyllum atratum]|nr:hypothetical protein FPV67DRAFT_1665489 [Lyophyllum atratum]
MRLYLPTSFSSPAGLGTITYARPPLPAGLVINFNDVEIGTDERIHRFYVLTCRVYPDPEAYWDSTIAPIATTAPRPEDHLIAFGLHSAFAVTYPPDSFESSNANNLAVTETTYDGGSGDTRIRGAVELPGSSEGGQKLGEFCREGLYTSRAEVPEQSSRWIPHQARRAILKTISAGRKASSSAVHKFRRGMLLLKKSGRS